MTDDDQDPKGGYYRYLPEIAIGFILGLSILAGLIITNPGGDPEPTTFSCSPHEDSNQYMRDRWITSRNISSYEDIPATERSNLSAEARDFLTSEYRVRDYNPILYNNLSRKNKTLFKRSINRSIIYNESTFLSSDLTDLNLVFYNGTVYYCDIETHGGADG
jgi:hypothetical protein